MFSYTKRSDEAGEDLKKKMDLILARKLAAVLLSTLLMLPAGTGCGSKSEAEESVRVIENPKILSQELKEDVQQKPAEKPEDKSEASGSEAQEPAKQGSEKPAEPQKPEEQKPEEPAAPKYEPLAPAHPEWKRGESREQSEETKDLMDRAASMQDYSHAPGKDADIIDEVDDNILLLVNKTHPVSKDYKADDMVTLSKITAGVGTDETHKMRKVAADALEELFKGAEADGYDIRLRTGYRSYSYQNTLYSNYVKNNGQTAADRFSARPGKSEHQTGLCCDVGVNGVSLTGFNSRPEAKWIAEHCHEYGFILRYPKEKEDITGYMYESWHIRYVGTAAAKEIFEQGLVLEEYLGVTD